MTKSVTILCGSSGVGKTTLVNVLQDKYEFHAFRCSAYDAVKDVDRILVNGKVDFERMCVDLAYALSVQEEIMVYFRERMKLLVKTATEMFSPSHIVSERGMLDPILYTQAYIALSEDSSRSKPTLLAVAHSLIQSSKRALTKLTRDLSESGVHLSMVYIPICDDYPYDTLNGIRPSRLVRDMVERVAEGTIRGNKNVSVLQPGPAEEYAKVIFDRVTKATERKR